MRIFLDLDGTILDVWPKLYFFYQRFMHRHERSCLSFDKFVELKLKSGKSSVAYEIILSQTGDQDLIPLYLEEFERTNENKQYLDRDVLNPKYKVLLKDLGPDLFLLTGRKHRAMLFHQLSKFGILDLFKEIITCRGKNRERDVLFLKTNILKQRAGSKDIYVGDTEVDVRAGKAAGIITVAVSNGVRSKSILEMEKPDFIIDSLIDLPKVIKLLQLKHGDQI